MRKFLLMAIFVLMPVIANAGAAILLLDAATATGAGPAEATITHRITNWSCDATITGSPTAVTVRIEGNQGRTALFSPTGMATHVFAAGELTAGIASFGIANTPVNQIRGNITTLTGGTNPTVTVICGGQ